MAVIKGNDLFLYINDNGTMRPFCHATSCTLTFTSDTIESTTKGSGNAKSFEYGFWTYTLQMAGLAILDETANFFALQQNLMNRVKVPFAFGDPNKSNVYYQGRVLVNTVDLSTDLDSLAAYNTALQGDGKLDVFTQAPVKNVDYVGTGVQDTILDSMLQPWTETKTFTYDGTNNVLVLDFVPNSTGIAVLNGLELDPFDDYKLINNTVVISKDQLVQNISYKLIIHYYK